MKWRRAIVGGFLAELLVLALLAPVAALVGTRGPVIEAAVVVASFFGPLFLMPWVARAAHARLVLHGAVVGGAAATYYMALALAANLDPAGQPPVYWAAHAVKVAGGMTGGFLAARRRARMPPISA